MISDNYGKIIILNGTPRSGKTSIVREIQEISNEPWINLGVDNYMKMIPEKFQPGIGLRPGGERPDLEPYIYIWYEALYQSIISHSKLGINVIVDVGHHENYSLELCIFQKCIKILEGYPAIFVGVHCPIEIIMERRIATWGIGYAENGSIPEPILLWQKEVHANKIYDIEVDTGAMSSKDCANLILEQFI